MTLATIRNLDLVDDELLNTSLLITGGVGSGKTVFLKQLIQQQVLGKQRKVGIICLAGDAYEYETFSREISKQEPQSEQPGSFTIFKVQQTIEGNFEQLDMEFITTLVEQVDVILVDEGTYTIGSREVLHTLMDLFVDKIVVIAAQSLDQLSTSQVYLESIINRFDYQVSFYMRNTFSSRFIFDEPVARTVSELPRGTAVVVRTNRK